MDTYQMSRWGVRDVGSDVYIYCAWNGHELADGEFCEIRLQHRRDAYAVHGLMRAYYALADLGSSSGLCRRAELHAPHLVRVTGCSAHENVRDHYCNGRPAHRESAIDEICQQLEMLLRTN